MNIILGSQSPRRRDLMAGLDIPFAAVTIDADETCPSALEAGDIPLYIARAKADAYIPRLHADDLLITADTIVWLHHRMLGKPHDLDEARQMLSMLSGTTHQVYTAVCFTSCLNPARPAGADNIRQDTLVDKTDVTFHPLTDSEIDYYVAHYRPLDKAGAYGVQEWIGYAGVARMEGSYFNVMGFPVDRVYAYLRTRCPNVFERNSLRFADRV